MELSLNRDNKLEVSTELRNASTTVNESLDNAINTGLMKMDLKDNMIKVSYTNVKAVTPGQFCVLYDNDVCLGGGIIKETFK